MRGFRSLRTHLVVVVLGSGLFVAVPLMLYGRWVALDVTERLVLENGRNQVEATVGNLDRVLHRVEQAAVQIASVLEDIPLSEETVEGAACSVLRANSDVFGSAIAFAEGAFEGRPRFAPYCFRVGETSTTRDLALSYDYLELPWYRDAAAAASPVWTEPYFDEGGGEVLMATFAVPLWRADGDARTLAGIVTTDVALTDLQEAVGSIPIAETGYAFLVSQAGAFMAFPEREVVMNETLESLARARDSTSLFHASGLFKRMESGVVEHRSIVTGDEGWLVFRRLRSSGWTVGLFFPRDEVLGELLWLSTVLFGLGALGVVLITAMVVVVARSITRPLRKLAAFTATVGGGDLEAEPPAADRRDEVGRLGRAFGAMQGSLKRTIQERAEMVAAQEQIDSELRIARDIQMNLMPTAPFGLQEQSGLDIAAVLEPARQVGGDFFDVFSVGPGRVCLIIGDVSGKGVPASLFMARVSALLRMAAREIDDPAAAVKRVNRVLAEGNDSYVFVTVLLAVLDTDTGEARCVNAGHLPPLAVEVGGRVSAWEGENGLPLGLFDGARYEVQQHVLSVGATLLLYTDGVTEALDEADRLFTEEALQDHLVHSQTSSAAALAESVMAAVASHRGQAAQSDDVALLAVRRLWTEVKP